MDTAIRKPAVAGRFYPARADELMRDVRGYISSLENPTEASGVIGRGIGRRAAIGCVAPHAGYIYSGGVAGAVYSQMETPHRSVILCPNHTGKGRSLAVLADTTWQTPLGDVAPDNDLAVRLIARYPLLEEDSAAHASEHAIEVQLPFLQVLQHQLQAGSQSKLHSEPRSQLKIVPIAIGTSNYDLLRGLGEALADVIGDGGETASERPLMIASSDMNHYESDAITRIKDRKAIERVLALDARGLWETVIAEKISMCGFGPTVVMLTAAKILGATSATLITYATSGEVSGDFESVVGYAGIIVQ